MNYWPEAAADAHESLADGRAAYVARYALGRDYHKVMRARLQQLADRVHDEVGDGYRVFDGDGMQYVLGHQPTQPDRIRNHRRESRPGLARQAYAAADARHGVVFFPG